MHRDVWPAFMLHADTRFDYLYTTFARYQLLLWDLSGGLIGIGQTVPFAWDRNPANLPLNFDELIQRALECQEPGEGPTTLSAVAAVVAPNLRGQGLSTAIINEMVRLAGRHQLTDLVAPVRPTMKDRYPLTSMERYVEWKRKDGSPFDPWLRVHWRIGGIQLHVLPEALTVRGTVAKWEEWTGMELPESGLYVVPGALQPIVIDRDKDVGLYCDPNVWVRHSLSDH